ncbi:MAG TPA: SOS response-associated peptidase family protein [Brevundimonas sp.]|jgi:putative SOS response-associated peptidase YedK|uniref:SOS response-associated peptidase family protein n=1 Tax=Brevundimonas sp. TaxID=1871086 RepID=UPI002DE959C3|nr:SOS response-associated peptidase family protein [Brevundimonas sp.]
MCASYEAKFSIRQLVDLFTAARAPLSLSGGLPNLEPVEEVRPTDAASAVRVVDGAADLVGMRFGFPPPPGRKGGPVINFRSEGREITNGARQGRALVPASGFYEFTGDKYPKTRWKLTAPDGSPLLLAAVWRAGEAGEAFSLLTAEPGPDVAPYHTRGVLPLPPVAWADWLFARRSTQEILAPPPAGTLIATAAPRG